MKKYICILLCTLMSVFFFFFCSGGEKEVTAKELSITLPSGERQGSYTGTLVDGIPNGLGIFESVNDEGIQWTYEGEFVNGSFDGIGKTTWENGQMQEGTYSNGLWTPTYGEWLKSFSEQAGIKIPEKTLNFINENEALFQEKDVDLLQQKSEAGISYKMITKEPSAYGEKFIRIDDLAVIQIFTGQISADAESQKWTEVLAIDQDWNIYEMCMLGELPDVYEGDTLSASYGVVLGNSSYEKAGGGFANSILIALCYAEE